ncbi:hypothetical protein GXP64_19465 [Rhodovulum sulfidophilum]|nr:hypothetical protein [Rhodovulum sulfidophilum]NDK37002.1 hypothetical protein [Rhodovulum sulfidophilum]
MEGGDIDLSSQAGNDDAQDPGGDPGEHGSGQDGGRALRDRGEKDAESGGSSYETVGRGRFMHVQEQIDFRCVQSRFVMRRNGEIEITGSHIKINGKRIDLN